ncbi:hypothetical protein LTR99_002319 [Exophiala xenobiotica]|uniref:Eukaryotic translation initiation factor 3 subunit M n=1 Tax=Vermiconidia calcicola TaxID=1690605 RepID=A0AAV9QIE5_9PEZI|nr:hypothetical protein H2202_000696 [Exophiala xenobiotica]KAK5542344.1 hypothetical protein LTR25_002229 [Vermiconidia calcicola]KAK5546202.1 hypothetical protein LTR23_003653 [Chaetothyriales sp. CCFEE 6169]KAK5195794.1 hypothetical protein LTR92_004735 [Exophiala xenobiotica]KAK5225902.1 hypothetical protein LTR72_003805 [Exophiala xenobiotica]
MPGPSNTLLIEGSFSELAEELAHYLDTLAKSEEGAGVSADVAQFLNNIREAEQSEEPVDESSVQQQKDEVLKKIVTKASVLNSAPERELTAAYNLLISLSLQSQISEQFFARICQYLSEQPITSSPTYGSSLALQTLSTIFNVLPSASEARYHVFLAILKVIKAAASAQVFEALIPQLETNIPSWLSTWQLDDEDARTLYMTVADVAEATGHHDLHYKYLLDALETISPDSSSEPEAQDLAKRTLRTALTNPNVTDFTPLTANDAIQAVRKSDSNLFDLLEIFSSDDYSSYTDFLETNDLSSLGIPEENAEVLSNKIRLLTLASIAASSTTRSIPYSTIASALQIPGEDVEMWVIDAIRSGLVEGKLSQLKQEFLVQRATYRVFGEKQWAEIQGRLMVWRRSLETVLSVVKTERERFAREGPGGGESGMNGFVDGESFQNRGDRQRRQGGGGGRGGRGGGYQRDQREPREQQGPREVDAVGGGD